MIRIAEYVDPTPEPFWQVLRQIGVDDVVTTLPKVGVDGTATWSVETLGAMVDRYGEHGLAVAAIEEDDTPPLNRARLGAPGADEEIEVYCDLVRNMGRAGIPVLCYNWMAVIGWQRTSFAVPARGGALVSGFDAGDPATQVATEAGTVLEEHLWDTLEAFLTRVVPVAEASGVRLAMHPDDPPLSPMRGIGRIMSSSENFQRLIDIIDSPANAITFCQGNFALMTDDLPAAIRHFGSQERIAFGHFRDVEGDVTDFVETFHDNGPTDMLACMRAWSDIGFDGVLRPDHVPTLAGESNDQPGYARLARLFAVGYMTGLREAATADIDVDVDVA
jgi:mannonate dehydratase